MGYTFTFPDASIEAALRRANAEKKRRDASGAARGRKKPRPLSYDFARAFVELLRKKYAREQTLAEPRTFEDLMEHLLDALYCAEPNTRHGYKQVAGILFAPFANFARARQWEREAGLLPSPRGGEGRRPHRSDGGQLVLELRGGRS